MSIMKENPLFGGPGSDDAPATEDGRFHRWAVEESCRIAAKFGAEKEKAVVMLLLGGAGLVNFLGKSPGGTFAASTWLDPEVFPYLAVTVLSFACWRVALDAEVLIEGRDRSARAFALRALRFCNLWGVTTSLFVAEGVCESLLAGFGAWAVAGGVVAFVLALLLLVVIASPEVVAWFSSAEARHLMPPSERTPMDGRQRARMLAYDIALYLGLLGSILNLFL